MTLPDNDNTEKEKQRDMDINKVFKEMLLQASNQGRVVAGMYECAKHLQTNPEKIFLCVLPVEDAVDDMVHMQHVLVEAYCRENRIRIVKVDSSKKLEKFLLLPKYGKRKDLDFSCALVMKPKDNNGNALGQHLKTFLATSSDVIVIPV